MTIQNKNSLSAYLVTYLLFQILNQVKVGLEEDRRSLMEHVSLLLSQYHELLTHSLEDKEHYHTEEKLFRYITIELKWWLV